MSASKSAYVLQLNIQALLTQYGLERVGFLTLTFTDNVTDIKEANRRLNSLMTGYLRYKLDAYILIRERQKRGAWHFHLLAVFPFDIKTLGKFTRFGSRYKFNTKNYNLINTWHEFNEVLPNYGFGRPELLPIRKDCASVASYLSKYLGKHAVARRLRKVQEKNSPDSPVLPSDLSVRLVSYSRPVFDSAGKYVSGFLRKCGSGNSLSWHSPFMSRVRKKVSFMALNERCKNSVDALQELGRDWGLRLFRVACHLVAVQDCQTFNDLCSRFCPTAPLVCFVGGTINDISTGEVYF